MSLREAFVLFLAPVSLTFLSYPLLFKWSFARKLPKSDFLITLLVVSLFLLVFSLSLFGLLSPVGFKLFSLVLFAIGLFGSFLFVRQGQYLNFLSAPRNFQRFKEVVLADPLKAFLVAALIAFTAKLILFSLFRPIIDADPTTSSLPFARSIFLEDHIPPRNLYDGNPMLLPPVGSSVLFAWIYAVSGSYLSESFRLIMIPFYLGAFLITYLLGRKLIGEKEALLGTFIFLALPIHDSVLFEGLFYPEVIFLFLALFVIYFLAEIIFKRGQKDLLPTGGLVGLAVAVSLLFKLQGLFLLYFVGTVLFLILTSGASFFRFLAIIFLVSPFLFRPYFDYGFEQPSLVVTGAILLTMGFLFLLVQERLKVRRQTKSAFFKVGLLIFSLSLSGGIWLLRNFLLHGHAATASLPQAAYQLHLGYLPERFLAGEEWTVLVAPLLGTFFVLPKIYGLREAIRRKSSIYLLLWVAFWYAVWISYLGAGDAMRYLFPLAPALALLSALGLIKIGLRINRRIVAPLVVVLVLASLFQSLFLWWNGAVLFRGPSMIPSQMGSAGGVVKTQGGNFVETAETFIRLLTFRDNVSYQDASALFLVGVIVFLFAWLAILMIREARRILQIRTEKLAWPFGLIFFLPYLFLFLAIGQGSLSRYQDEARKRVYTHWGRYNVVVPFLVRETSPETAILVIGHPAGFSYYSNLPVLSLNYGYEYEKLAELLNLGEGEGIRKFLRENGFSFVALDTLDAKQGRHEELRKKTLLLDLLESQDFFEKRVSPSPTNSWAIYEVL